jgi:endonuclease YncB( thermonuclease family)
MSHRLSDAVVRIIAAAFATLLSVGAFAQGTLAGRVVGITDGDTITVLDASKTQHKIRVAGIDAPEKGQPGGQWSKESLSALVYGQPVRIEGDKQDRYGRTVGKVWVAPPDSQCRGKPDCPMTLDAGLALITIGRAWWYRKYASEQSAEDRARYESAEQEARAKKAGLWRDGTAVPPWEWRAARTNSGK